MLPWTANKYLWIVLRKQCTRQISQGIQALFKNKQIIVYALFTVFFLRGGEEFQYQPGCWHTIWWPRLERYLKGYLHQSITVISGESLEYAFGLDKGHKVELNGNWLSYISWKEPLKSMKWRWFIFALVLPKRGKFFLLSIYFSAVSMVNEKESLTSS